MNSGDVELLESVDDIDGGLHSCVGGRLITIGFDLHATSDSDEGLASSEISDVDKGVVPGGKDVADGKYVTSGVLGT